MRFGQDLCHTIGGRAVHPVTSLPGGQSIPFSEEDRDEYLKRIDEVIEFSKFSLELGKKVTNDYIDVALKVGILPTYYVGMANNGVYTYFDGTVRVMDPEGKIVADFGCGPRGSLCWAIEAKKRIGIDILARAFERFIILEHNMIYICSTDTEIPLPSSYIDVLFTLNALDHVNNLSAMCKEILRILAPGGDLIASFNLNEEATVSEPQTLTENLIKLHLLRYLDVRSYRIRPKGEDANPYEYFFKESPIRRYRGPRILWVRASKH